MFGPVNPKARAIFQRFIMPKISMPIKKTKNPTVRGIPGF
jgi:hypothetical protein